jgi:hypothetical protein
MRFFLFLISVSMLGEAFSQEKTETREMVGHLGSRGALLALHSTQRADGSWRMTGEYIVLATLARRFLEGERGPELGITTLKEGTSAILFGHPITGELRGSLRDSPRGGDFKGTRYGPGGQERERFEFSEDFPSMDGYSANVHCEAGDERYTSSLHYSVEAGKLKSFEWRSKISPAGHACALNAPGQQPAKGALRFTSGRCSVTLRDLGEYIKVAAEDCAAQCGSEAYLEPILVDRRAGCKLLRPER